MLCVGKGVALSFLRVRLLKKPIVLSVTDKSDEELDNFTFY